MTENTTVTENVDVNYNVPKPQKREAAEQLAADNNCDAVHSCSCGGFVPVQTERSTAHADDQVQQRTHMANFEVREDDNGQPTIRGYAAVFEAETRIGSFTEKIARGAFDEVLETADVRALFNHDANMILARRHSDGSGTLKLYTDETGLAYEFTPGQQTYARDLVESMKRGDINASSFAFTIADQDWSADHSERTVNKVGMLLDIAPVTYPAYKQTSATLRHEEAAAEVRSEPETETPAEVRNEAPQPKHETISTNPYNMKNSNELKELRGKHTSEFDAINAAADADGRNLTEAESQRCDFLNAEILRIDDKLKRAIQQENMVSRMAQMGGNTSAAEVREVQKVSKSFSIARAASQIMQQGKLDGAELEWKQEAEKEARDAGVRLTGQIAIPDVALRTNADDFSTSGDGDGFVGTNVGGAIAALREQPLVQRLGATVITGASGDIQFPRVSAKAVGQWALELGAAADATMEMDDLLLSPKKVAAKTRYSRMLLTQGGPSVDAAISADIAAALNAAIDTAAFTGSGASGQPLGILDTTGVINKDTAGATNTTDLAALVTDMEASLIAEGAAEGATYVFSPKAGNLAKLAAQVDSVSGLWNMDANNVNGYNALISGYLPNVSATLGRVVMGNFRQLVLAYFGSGIDILVDPYTLGENGNIKLVATRFVDLGARQAKAFAICEDVAAA